MSHDRGLAGTHVGRAEFEALSAGSTWLPLSRGGHAVSSARQPGARCRRELIEFNGQLASSVLESRAQPAIVEPTVIGGASLTEAFFAGSIDEVAVYPAVLTAARVQAHHFAGTAP